MLKNILIFSTAYLPFVGGAELAVKEITDRIQDHEFDMVTAKMDAKLLNVEKIGNITVHRIGIGHPFFDKIFLVLFGHYFGLKLHKIKKYDAVWAIMASYGGFAALSFKLKTGVKFLLTLQEGDPIEYILKKVRFVRRRFYLIFKKADGLQPISNFLMNWGKKMGFVGNVSEVIPNGVDVARFTKDYPREEMNEIRKSFGFAENSVILITASRLVIKNGIEDVIKALPLLPDNVCFAICGVGELKGKLENAVKELNLEKRVKFLGNKSHEELPKILKACDIFIRPSLSEGLGNAFLEAMAAGLPTIGTLVGGIPDFLRDGETGFVCELNNPKSVAEAVKKAMNLSPENKSAVCNNAMNMINEKYNWDKIAVKMRNLFERLV
ncbi:MAG: glycosyltransferase family 4 protein [Patescibacteria group bacterium]|nr:glycosyltransferase family 4 protein [Patescibacteria group bacterium]